MCAATLAAGTANAAWRVGARGGLGMSSIRGSFADVADPHWRLSPIVGGFIELEAASALAVAVEAAYVQKGVRYVFQDFDPLGNPLGTTTDVPLVLEYAEVPILLRAFLPGTRLRPYLVAGPTFGFALRGTAEPEGGAESDETDQMKTLDVGATGGVGVRVATRAGTLDVEARYGTGFGDLWDVSNNLESIHQGFWLTVGLAR